MLCEVLVFAPSHDESNTIGRGGGRIDGCESGS